MSRSVFTQKFFLYAMIVILSFMAGCSLYTAARVKSVTIPDQVKNDIHEKNEKFTADDGHAWWKNFGDPQLNNLVECAFAHNLNYRIAIQNIQLAKTYVDANMSNLFPQINLNYSVRRARTATNGFTSNVVQGVTPGAVFNLYELYGSASYELDVWKKIQNSVKQAKINVKVSNANSQVIKLTLLSDVVTLYFQIIATQKNLENLEQQYAVANANVTLLDVQYQSGLIDIGPLDDAKIQAQALNIQRAQLRNQHEILRNTLAYLVGEYPETFTAKTGSKFTAKPSQLLIPRGLSSTLLLARPDVRSAYEQVLSYDYGKKQALANFFPTFNLIGDDGFSSVSLSNLLAHGSRFWDGTFAATQVVFDYLKRSSQYEAAKIHYRMAMLNYKNVVLNAFTEVNNALSTYQQDYNALASYQQKLINTQEKLQLAQAQQQAGLIDALTYNSYALSTLASEYDVVNQRAVVVADIVHVYQTIGLGLSRHRH